MRDRRSPSAWIFLPIATALLLVGAATSVADEPSRTDREQEPSKDGETAGHEEHVEVHEYAPDLETTILDLEVLKTGRAPNLGLALETIPGLAGVRRSQNSFEPVVRGLGWERVQTQVNGMPLFGACPARMDPPAFLVTASSAQSVSVVKGLASVAFGPAGTGGRIDVSTDYDRGLGAGRATDPWARISFNGANDGLQGGAGVAGGTAKLDYALGVEAQSQSDYSSADGTVVPAAQEDVGGHFSFGHRVTDAQRWSVGAVYQDGGFIAYPSLPMDTDGAETWILSGAYRYQPDTDRGSLSSLEVSLGASTVDHLMSNRERTNRAKLQAETRSEAGTASAGLSTRWRTTTRSEVKAGLDIDTLQRNALRRRYTVPTGMTAYDHMWPDVTQDDIGLFAEYALVPGQDWHLRFGGRYDAVSSAAAAADDPGLGKRTIRENYVRFYGPRAATTDRDEGLVSGNVVVSKQLGERVAVQGGIGLVSRAANVTERYFAFAPAPNGFVVGNPALDAERKREVSFGATFGGRRLDGNVSAYYYSFADYILPIVLDRIDVNGDGVVDLVRGFENTDATLTGFEFSAVYRVGERWSIPGALFYVQAKNDANGEPLPEIPPLEGRLAGRWSFAGSLSGWLELGGRFVARQDRIDVTFGENTTPGFSVWHLRGRFSVARYLTIDAGVENLLDKEYWEHLTREAAGNVPGLERGQEIPQPGRWVSVALRFEYK